jgi:aarF domain-containing kinase
MLFLFHRNINTIRAIAREHGDPVDRYTLMARSACQGAFKVEEAALVRKMQGYLMRANFEVNLW